MAYKTLSIEKQGHVAYVRLTRPDTGNAVDAALLGELDAASASINDDADARVVVLTADGDTFSRGWAEGESAPARRDAAPFACLESMAQPVVCALNGDAISAGLELALACDLRIAAEGARFALPETGAGTLPAGGGTQRLPRLIGRGQALRFILLGEEIDAAEALRIGLVSAVAPSDRLLAEATALAERIASRGPIAVRYAKEAVRRGLDQPLDQALRYETDLTVILQSTEDRAEGVRAFLEKREPKFKGR